MQFDPATFVADPELFFALKERSTPLWCHDNQTLFERGEQALGVYLVDEGQVSLFINGDDGKPVWTYQAAAGSLLGLPGFLGNQPYSMTAVAHAGARVSFVNAADFNSLMISNPHLSIEILRVLAADVRTIRRALK